MRALLCILGILLTGPAPAQEAPVTLDIAGIVALAERPWRDRDATVAALRRTLGGFRADPGRTGEGMVRGDPWLWSITGRFGADRRDLATPGGIVACSRYGIDTRDRMAGADLSDPRLFRLFRLTMAAHDDAAAWPADAVARLACMITWDDTRRVAILPLAGVEAALRPLFADVTVTGDAEAVGDGWRAYSPLYGAEGYRVAATDGPRGSAAWVEGMLVELRVTHQRITFRAFLLGGGV